MKASIRFISLLLVLLLAATVMLTSCNQGLSGVGESETESESESGGGEYVPDPNEYKLPLEDGYNQLTFYWSYKGGTYENCDIWIWWGDKAGQGYLFHECNYGAKVVINVPEDVGEVGFIVRRDCSEPGGSSWGNATKDYESDRFAIIEGKDVWRQGS